MGLWFQEGHYEEEVSVLRVQSSVLKFACTVCTAGLSLHHFKPHGVHYITVTKVTFVHINTAHQKRGLIACSLSQIQQIVESFFP
jgi:hypothetical protein